MLPTFVPTVWTIKQLTINTKCHRFTKERWIKNYHRQSSRQRLMVKLPFFLLIRSWMSIIISPISMKNYSHNANRTQTNTYCAQHNVYRSYEPKCKQIEILIAIFPFRGVVIGFKFFVYPNRSWKIIVNTNSGFFAAVTYYKPSQHKTIQQGLCWWLSQVFLFPFLFGLSDSSW